MADYTSTSIPDGTELDRRLGLVSTNEFNWPTSGEKAALAGTYGTVGSANKYVTNSDPRILPYIDATKYGMVADGVTDNTTALNNAIAEAITNGRPLYIPAGLYKITGQITIPNNNAAYPIQTPLQIIGAGSSVVSMYFWHHRGGTTLDMTYSGSGGKFVTKGLAVLRIEGITFWDSAGTTTPFIFATNTVLYLRYNAFVGMKDGLACDQDAIVLGSAVKQATDNTLDSAFSGWGTVIENNYFDHIRRAIYGLVWANAIIFSNNTIWYHCGSNLENGAAIEFDNPNPELTSHSGGNIISNNFCEIKYYAYMVKLRMTNINTLAGNTVFDPTANTKAMYYFGYGATLNSIIGGGYSHDVKLYETELDDMINVVIDSRGMILSNEYRFQSQNGLFSGEGSPEGVRTAPVGSVYLDTTGTAGATMYIKEVGTGNTGWTQNNNVNINGGSA